MASPNYAKSVRCDYAVAEPATDPASHAGPGRFRTSVTDGTRPGERCLHASDGGRPGRRRGTRRSPRAGHVRQPGDRIPIARIAPERGGELVTAVGPLLGAQVGEFLRLRGRWSAHPKYGRQFEVHSYATVLPATAAGIQKYLGSGLIKGIGLASPYMGEVSILAWGVRFVVGPLPAVRVGVTGRRHG